MRRRGLTVLFCGLAGLSGAACSPGQQTARSTAEKAVGTVASGLTGQGAVDRGCRLLDDPSVRSHMSGALENKLLRLCRGSSWSPAETAAPARQRASDLAASRAIVAAAAPGTDIPVSDPALDTGGSTQSETTLVAVGNILCAAWNDAGEGFGTNGFSGHGVSSDGGATFSDRGPFPSGPLDSNFGDPSLAYSVRDNTFYFAALSSAGLSMWRSIDGCQSFTYVGPIHAGMGDDKELIAVDNAPASPFFGRIHIGWTDFAGSGDLNVAAHSDNGGVTWTAPVSMPGSGSNGQGMYPAVAPNGDVWMAALNEGNSIGSLQDQRIYRSNDGGQSFTRMTDIASGQLRPEDPQSSIACGRQALKGNIRLLPSPQIVVTADESAPAGYVVHAVYAYDSDGAGPDHANVFYRRSVDGAVSWSPESRLNDDTTATDQFFPALGVSETGTLVASWYDRRLDPVSNLAFDRYLTFSSDGGATWNPNVRISDVSSPVAQTLPNFDGLAECYHGDYDQVAASGNVAHVLWSDDRRITASGPNPDVYYDQFLINPSLGRVRVAQSTVSCTGTIAITLADHDLTGTGNHAVAVTSNRGDSETLSLAEVSSSPGTFAGSIDAAAGPVVPGDGILEVQNGDVITVTYNDADDGTGQPAVATVEVTVDCVGPVVTNVRATPVAPGIENVAADTSEPAQLRVDYGITCGALTQTRSGSGFSQSPSVTITGLAPATTYFFAVTATDRSGNSTRDDNGGLCYAFKTPEVVFTADFEKDLNGFTVDNNVGNGHGLWHLSGACAAMVFGHSVPHSLYYGRDATCTYDNGLANSGKVTSPTIALGSATFASLDLNYFLGTEGGGFFDRASVEVSANGGPFQTVDSNFARLEDEDPDVRTRTGAEAAGGFALVENTAHWLHASIDLSTLLGGGSGPATLQVRFGFDTVDSAVNNFAGFYVDDVTISGVAPERPCQANADCDDGLFCTGVETCQSGFCAKGAPILCGETDTVDCTEDVCDEATKGCVDKPSDARCDDGTFCNGAEVCDLATGCHPGTSGCGDDGIACTLDSCVEPLKLCAHQPADFLCNDGLFCTGVETCDPTSGCKSSGFPCNDGVACSTDQCDELKGCSFVPDNSKCDDGLFCTGVETCQPGLGCVTTGDPCPGPDACNEKSRQCAPTCFTDTNVHHETGGRAFHKKQSFYALGTDDALGKGAAVTSLQGGGASWHRVPSCPAPPSIASFTASVIGDVVNISGTTSDANGDVSVVKLTISSSAAPPITLTASGTVNFSGQVALVPGAYTVVAQAFDAAGLFSPVTAPIPFVILPFAPPRIDSIAVSVNGVHAVVSGTASDVNHDITFVQITILQDGSVVGGVVATGKEAWSGTLSTLLPGSYGARAQAFDGAGLVSDLSAVVPFTIVERCITGTNASHQAAGRAGFSKQSGYRAVGSNDALGRNEESITALEGSAGSWKRVVSCPVPSSVSPVSEEPPLISLEASAGL